MIDAGATDPALLRFATGPAGEDPADMVVDLDRLVRTRLLIQAESGGGKSWMIRYLLEETHGYLPHLLFDLEGEFASLRERFAYVLVSATEGEGDLPARPDAARTLCRRLSELGASAILDLFDLDGDDQQRFVRLFLEDLLSLPRSMWGPRLVVVDEADRLAPERGNAESAAAVNSLVKRGRKRGLGTVLAVQRLSDLDKGAAGGLQNKLIGLTTLDTDVKRTGDDLGFDKEARAALKELAPGEFYAFGPAIPGRGVVLARSGHVSTTHEHGEHGPQLPPPPPPEALSEVLDKLAASLRAADIQEGPEPAETNGARSNRHGPEDFEREVRRRVEAQIGERLRTAVEEAERRAEEKITALQARVEEAQEQARTLLDVLSDAEPRPDRGPAEERQPSSSNGATPDGPSPGARHRILTALRDLEALGIPSLTRNNLAVFADQGPRSSAFSDHLAALKDEELVAYPAPGAVALTEKGRDTAGGAGLDAEAARSLRGLHDAWRRRLSPASARILSALIESHPADTSRELLAEQSGQSHRSSAFRDRLAELRSLGLVEYPRSGHVRATELLFPEGLR